MARFGNLLWREKGVEPPPPLTLIDVANLRQNPMTSTLADTATRCTQGSPELTPPSLREGDSPPYRMYATNHTQRVRTHNPPVLHFLVCKTSQSLPLGIRAFGKPHDTTTNHNATHHTTPHHTTPQHQTRRRKCSRSSPSLASPLCSRPTLANSVCRCGDPKGIPHLRGSI